MPGGAWPATLRWKGQAASAVGASQCADHYAALHRCVIAQDDDSNDIQYSIRIGSWIGSPDNSYFLFYFQSPAGFKIRCFTHTDPTYKLEVGVENDNYVVKYLSTPDTTS